MCTGFWCRHLRVRDHLEDPGIGGRIILKLIFKKWDGGGWGTMDWIDLAQNRDSWWAFMNAVKKLWVP